MSASRVRRLLRCSESALRQLEKFADDAVESHLEANRVRELQGKRKRMPSGNLNRLERLIARLGTAINECSGVKRPCVFCGETGGQHYGNCPAATPATMIKGPGE